MDYPTSLAHLFSDAVARGGNRAALFLANHDASSFTALTWTDLAHEVRRLAAGLRRAGLQPGDRLVQVSENRYEWILLDFAVHLARGVHVALHASLSGPQIASQIADSGARTVVLSCAAFATTTEDVRLSWLPLSHIFARTCDLYTWLVRASQLAIVEDREHLISACSQLKPTLLNGVPYLFEKICRRLTDTGKLGPVEPVEPTHLQKLLGGAMRACCSGGAALPDHVAEFFSREGVPLVQGYGL